MGLMSGTAFNEPSPGPPWGENEPEDEELFATALVVSNPPKKARVWLGVRTSLVVHVVVLLSVILIPIYWPAPLPETTDYVRALLYDPPPPPPPPLPKGSSLQQKVEPAKPVTPAEQPVKTAELTAPIEVPVEPDKIRPEDRPPESEQAGSETGSEVGLAEGMEGGVEGGVVGGTLGGVLGGVLGGTGTGPVLDYDQPPRPIKTAKPQYPQEAFVKKIEGTVVVEILIDANGRVVRARVVQSIPLLDAAAIQTAYQFVFTPAVKRGRPVATVAHIPVTFRIF
jgi:protein TonB